MSQSVNDLVPYLREISFVLGLSVGLVSSCLVYLCFHR